MQFSIKPAIGGADQIKSYELPWWVAFVILVDSLILLPALLIFNYTFKMIYPIFAIIEDENVSVYEPVPLNDRSAENVICSNDLDSINSKPRIITSSFRSINRCLIANGGIKANFRGFFCFLAQVCFTSVLIGIFAVAFGGFFMPVATLLGSLVMAQFSTAWVHIVISEQSALHFWSRLPPFRRTVSATWKAITLYWFAGELTRFLPFLLAVILGLKIPRHNEPMDMNVFGFGFFIKLTALGLVTLCCSIFAITPAYAILIRIQASVIPVGTNTIIPFDRSFCGKVEPEVVDGKGYATVTDAWRSLSKTTCRRLLTVYIKLFCLSTIAGIFLVTLLLPQIYCIAKYSKEVRS